MQWLYPYPDYKVPSIVLSDAALKHPDFNDFDLLLRNDSVDYNDNRHRVFADPMAVTRQDRIENGEQRWQTIGAVGGFTLLLVAQVLWLCFWVTGAFSFFFSFFFF